MKKRYIIGIDFGTAYTYIVYFEETEDGGVVKRTPISLLSDVCKASEAGIRSCVYEATDGSFYAGQEAEEKSTEKNGCDPDEVKIVLQAYAKKLSETLGEKNDGDYKEYVDIPELNKTRESDRITTKYFEAIFDAVLKSQKYQELANKNATDVEFIIGTPPGCGKTYAEELKQCVKNGYREAKAKLWNDENLKLSLKTSCYPEPLLAGYAWLNKNNNAKGLRDNESCFVVDIGAGTADFAFLERTDGKIKAKETALDRNGQKILITCGGTELGKHAGNVINEKLSTDLNEYLEECNVIGGEVRKFVARELKEKLHQKGSKGSEPVEIYGENVLKDDVALKEKNFCVYTTSPNAGHENPLIPSLKFADILENFSALREEFDDTANQIVEYFSKYNIANCNKILFVGGSSHLTALKDTVTEAIKGKTGKVLARLDLDELADSRKEDLSSELELDHSSAVAIGACLAYNRPELITTPPLRIYIENKMRDDDAEEDGNRLEVHSLIDHLGYCTGPLVITKNEIKQDIGSTLRFYFRETGDLVDKDGKSAFNDKTFDILNLREPSEAQKQEGFDFVDESGRLLKDTGKRWPENGTFSLSVRTESDANLIIFASKHGNDFNKSFVYFLQKIEKRRGDDGNVDEDLKVIDSFTGKEFDFKIQAKNGDTLNADEVDFNQKSKFHRRRNKRNYYYYVGMKVGDNNKKIALDEALTNPKLVTDPDMKQYIKIFNGNWNDEN